MQFLSTKRCIDLRLFSSASDVTIYRQFHMVHFTGQFVELRLCRGAEREPDGPPARHPHINNLWNSLAERHSNLPSQIKKTNMIWIIHNYNSSGAKSQYCIDSRLKWSRYKTNNMCSVQRTIILFRMLNRIRHCWANTNRVPWINQTIIANKLINNLNRAALAIQWPLPLFKRAKKAHTQTEFKKFWRKYQRSEASWYG